MDENTVVEELRFIALSLLKTAEGLKPRYIVKELRASLKTKPRIKLLKGFRGVGKTTALLQLFGLNSEKSLYFSADHPLIKEEKLYNAGRAIIKAGYNTLFIDEVHTYPNWRVEIKALHDEFPHLMIVASGSAPLALNPERREEMVALHQLDFGEFFFFKEEKELSATVEWTDKEAAMRFIASNPNIESEFHRYIRDGGFPSSLEIPVEKGLDAIYHSIRKSVREDAVFFLKMSKSKIFGMGSLLIYLATSPPGELSFTSLSKSLKLSKTVVYEIINALEDMEIIRVIRPYKKGLALVRGEPKLLFHHPNLRFAVCKQLGKMPDTGAVREELAVFSLIERGWTVHTIKGLKKSPDYAIEKDGKKLIIEIGGKKKKRAQLKGFANGIVLSEYQLLPLSISRKKV